MRKTRIVGHAPRATVSFAHLAQVLTRGDRPNLNGEIIQLEVERSAGAEGQPDLARGDLASVRAADRLPARTHRRAA